VKRQSAAVSATGLYTVLYTDTLHLALQGYATPVNGRRMKPPVPIVHCATFRD
jgi:hypothetical protein